MQILRIYQFLPPAGGGMERHIEILTSHQRKAGHDVTIIYNTGSSKSKNDIQILPGISLLVIKSQAVRDIVFYFFVLLTLINKPKKFDAIHIHGDWCAFALGRLVSLITRPRITFASIHCNAQYSNPTPYRIALKSYDKVFCTGFGDVLFLKSLGIRKCLWAPSGVSPIFYIRKSPSTVPGKLDVVLIGNLVQQKNFPLALQIAELLPQRTFGIIGDGKEYQFIRNQITNRKIKNVTLLGRLSQADIAKQLATSRVFLSTSHSEGTPTVMLEALASGVPIVTYKSNVYTHLVIPFRTGFICNSEEAADAITHIEFILNLSNEEWNKMSDNCRRIAQFLDWDSRAIHISSFLNATEIN